MYLPSYKRCEIKKRIKCVDSMFKNVHVSIFLVGGYLRYIKDYFKDRMIFNCENDTKIIFC